MKKQLAIIGIIAFVLAASLYICLSEKSGSNNGDSELNKFVGYWHAGVGSIEGAYDFMPNGTFIRYWGAISPLTGRPGCLTGQYELKDGKLILNFDEIENEETNPNPFFNNTNRVCAYTYYFSNNDITLTLNHVDSEGQEFESYEKVVFI